ncbi:MAG TPA: T9SS type A sorting domain-containing protein, partial [Prolixibacteraceae bacterium]
SGILSVTASNSCGTSIPRSLEISVIAPPIQPDYFTIRTSKLCKGSSNVVYEVPNVPGTQYVWSYTGTGATITGGTSNSVLVSFSETATSGYVRVRTSNSCGILSASQSIYVTIIYESAPQPGAFFASSTSVCQGSYFKPTVPCIPGVNYNWSYSGTGAIIRGKNNFVLIHFLNDATSGTLSVYTTNCCGTSIPRTLDITVNSTPPVPDNFTIFTPSVYLGASNVAYEVPNVPGMQYVWCYTGSGATITGGTSNSVLVSFSETATSGYLGVKARTNCGLSPLRALYIKVSPALKSGNLSKDAGINQTNIELAKNILKVYPNPASGPVIFEFQISENAKAKLDLLSMNGKHIATIFDADVDAGTTQTITYSESLVPGVYIYTLRWNNQVITGKLIIAN